MLRSLVVLLIAVSFASAGAPPKRLPLDAFANGYLGVYRHDSQELLVDRLEKNGPAEKAGVLPGDVLSEIGTVEPRTFEDVRGVVGDLRPGTKLPIVVKRGEKKLSFVLVIGVRPESANSRVLELEVLP